MMAVLAATGLLVAGCSTAADPPAPTTAAPTTEPLAPSAPGPAVPDPAAAGMISPYFLRNTTVGAGQAVPAPGPDQLQAAIDALLAGPSDADQAADLHTDISTYVRLRSVSRQGETATVDFNRAFETANTRPQVAQVVYTLTQIPGITQVRFLIEGDTNGATGVPPISREDLADITPTILVEAPTPGAAPLRSFRVNGTAAPTLSEITWRVEVAGMPLAAGTTPANPVRGATRKRYSAAVDLTGTPAGPADLVVGTGGDEIRLPILVGP